MANPLATSYYNLSLMLDAGMPMLRALDTAAAPLKGRRRRAFRTLHTAASSGNSLAETMTKIPKVFAPLDVTIIYAAETSGNLPESFKLLSNWYEFRTRMIRTIRSGMWLPIVVLCFAAFLIPLPSVFLGGMNFDSYLQSVIRILAVFFIPAAVVIAIIRYTPPTGILRWLLDAFTLIIPGLGQGVRRLALSRYCRAFYMLYKAGVPIIQSAQKASSVTGNAVVANMLKGGSDSAKAGNPVCDGFSPRLPIEFVEVWQVGEQTGSLDDVTKRLADSNAERGEMLITEFCRWFPRIVYFAIVIWMAFMVIGGWLSLYQTVLTF